MPDHSIIGTMAALGFEVMFGSLTITGSLMAFGKLQELVHERADHLSLPELSNISLCSSLTVGVFVLSRLPAWHKCRCSMHDRALGLLIGVLIVLPIGGADMPVVISLLNSYAGLASAATVCHRQQRADHRWRARRRLWFLPLDADEPGHEPLVHQRAVRRGGSREAGRTRLQAETNRHALYARRCRAIFWQTPSR